MLNFERRLNPTLTSFVKLGKPFNLPDNPSLIKLIMSNSHYLCNVWRTKYVTAIVSVWILQKADVKKLRCVCLKDKRQGSEMAGMNSRLQHDWSGGRTRGKKEDLDGGEYLRTFSSSMGHEDELRGVLPWAQRARIFYHLVFKSQLGAVQQDMGWAMKVIS